MIIERRVCDYCFTHLGETHDATATRVVTIDKRGIEIDVCQKIEQKLIEALAPFISAGRRAPGVKSKGTPAPAPAPDPTSEFVCICGRSFDTQRGLTRHTNHPPVDSDPAEHAIPEAA